MKSTVNYPLQIFRAVLITSLLGGCSEKKDVTAGDGKPGAASNATTALDESTDALSSAAADPAASAPSTNSLSSEEAEMIQRLTLQLTGKDIMSAKTVTDAEDKPVTAQFPDGSKVFYQSSRPVAFVEASGKKTVYDYDPEGRLRGIIHPDGRRESIPVLNRP